MDIVGEFGAEEIGVRCMSKKSMRNMGYLWEKKETMERKGESESETWTLYEEEPIEGVDAKSLSR